MSQPPGRLPDADRLAKASIVIPEDEKVNKACQIGVHLLLPLGGKVKVGGIRPSCESRKCAFPAQYLRKRGWFQVGIDIIATNAATVQRPTNDPVSGVASTRCTFCSFATHFPVHLSLGSLYILGRSKRKETC